MYHLSTNMADRLTFDQAVTQFASDCYTSARQDNDYSPVALKAEWLKAWADDYCNDELAVDDMDEARARFEDAFTVEWQRQYSADSAGLDIDEVEDYADKQQE